MYQRRAVGLLLSIVAIGLVLIALVSRTWFESDGDDAAQIGLRSVEQCTKRWESAGTKCRDQSLGGFFRTATEAYEVPRRTWDDDAAAEGRRPNPVPDGFILLGTLTLLGGLASIVAIAATIIIAAAAPRPGPRGLATATALTCGGFVALVVAFVVAAPGTIDHLRAGIGPLLAVVGAASGVCGVLIIGRFDPAREPSAHALAAAAADAPLRRAPVLITGALGCALVLTSIFTQSWFRGSQRDTSLAVGVRQVEVCTRRGAASLELDLDVVARIQPGLVDSDRPSRGGAAAGTECRINLIPASVAGAQQPLRMRIFLASGNLTWMTGLAAVAVMLLVGGLALARQAVGGNLSAPRVLIAATGCFLVSAITYAMSRPSDVSEVSLSYGPFLALAGGASLVGAGLLLARWTAAMQLEGERLAATAAVATAVDRVPGGLAGLAVLAPPPGPSPFAPPPSPFAPPAPFTPPPPPPSPYAPAPPQSPYAPPAPAPYGASPFAQPFAPPAPVVIIPACPACATPMLWVSAKSIWLCTICRPVR